MVFWRLYNDKLYGIANVSRLGFPISDARCIPMEYINDSEYLVWLHTSISLGDIGVMSAIPRLLKQKYPHKKVAIPSVDLYRKLFSFWGVWEGWSDPSANLELIYENNPYVDAVLDSIPGEVFHDHYRVFDDKNPDEIPLVEEILKFWRFTDDEIKKYDARPELYFSQSEIEEGDKLIKKYIGDIEYGCILMACRIYPVPWGYKYELPLIEIIKENKDIPWFYYSQIPIEETSFNIPNTLIDFNTILSEYSFKDKIRLQLYIKNKAKLNVGYQAGINDAVGSRNTEMHCIPHPDHAIGSNIGRGINYYINGETHHKI